MVVQADRAERPAETASFDMGALWRLMLWGSTAAAAMTLVVVAHRPFSMVKDSRCAETISPIYNHLDGVAHLLLA
jgi:hypothetical protein